jgi:hypothetical protein
MLHNTNFKIMLLIGDIYYKLINGELIGKKAVQCIRTDKTTYVDWFESCDKTKIDTRYYNLNGTRK